MTPWKIPSRAENLKILSKVEAQVTLTISLMNLLSEEPPHNSVEGVVWFQLHKLELNMCWVYSKCSLVGIYEKWRNQTTQIFWLLKSFNAVLITDTIHYRYLFYLYLLYLINLFPPNNKSVLKILIFPWKNNNNLNYVLHHQNSRTAGNGQHQTLRMWIPVFLTLYASV